MSVGQYDLMKAVVSLWDTRSLDNFFTAYWTETEKSRHIVLHDSEASPEQAWPYCVFEMPRLTPSSRSSGYSQNEVFEIRDLPLTFHIHAKNTSSATGKAIAATLAEEIMKIFGGHPTEQPFQIRPTHGRVLNCQYQTDFGLRTGDEEHKWMLEYRIEADVPTFVTN